MHERTDGKINQSSPDSLQTFQAGHVVQTHLNFRIRPPESLHVLGQDIKNRRPSGRHIDETFIHFQAALMELFVQMFHLLNQGHGHFEEQFAVMGELYF